MTSFSQGGTDTQVPSVDGVPLISTPSNRMYTAIKINDGKTGGQEQGGYREGDTAKDINFMITTAYNTDCDHKAGYYAHL